MSIKDELEKSIPKMKLTEKEKALICTRIHHPRERRFSFKPIVISIAILVILNIFLWSALPQRGLEENAVAPQTEIEPPNEAMVAEDEESDDSQEESPKEILYLTDEQKRTYYAQYQKIIDEANALKLGTKWGLSPIEEWEDSYWMTPEEFEQRVQRWIDDYRKTEREKVARASSNLKETKTENEVTTKGTFIYISGILKEIEVSAEFDTQYNEELNRQVFSGVNHVTTKLVYSHNWEWEQTNYKATLKDNGKTYEIRIEGIVTGLGMTNEKAFTIEFTCDEAGNIH